MAKARKPKGPPPIKELPTDKVLKGSTSGKLSTNFQITADGAAVVNIPLWVPPGRAGMQPSISLHYDSRRGNDLLGVGWTLSATSIISRCRLDQFHDKDAQPVNFTSDDAFCLDGQRLVLISGVHGREGAEYKTHCDSFKKIILNNPDALGPTSFTVYLKGGNILTFGPHDDSRITGNRVNFFIPPTGENNIPGWDMTDDLRGIVPLFNQPVRYAWLLSEIRDRSGNTILFSWFDFQNQEAPGFYGQPSTEKLLQEIRYTSRHIFRHNRRKPNPKSLRRIVFNYEQRPDVTDEFVSGLRLWHPARLSGIEMHGPDPVEPDLLRLYTFDYIVGTTGRSLLDAITESDGQKPVPVSKPAHRFEYQENLPAYDDIDTGISDIRTTPGGRSGLAGRIHVMDIDGDGKDDILYASATRPGFYAFRLAQTDSGGRPFFSPEFATNIPLSARLDRPMPFDFDGDGRTDLLTFDDTYNIGDGYGTQYIVCSPSTDPATGQFTMAPASALIADIAEVCDLDGDGRADLVFSPFNDNGTPIRNWNFALNTTGQFSHPSVIPQVGPDDHLLVDIDGDGAVEVLTCLGQPGGPAPVPGEWYSVLRLGRKSNSPLQVISLRPFQKYLFIDLNGDGLLDAIWEGQSSNDIPSVILNSGNGFFGPVGQPFGNLAYYGAPVKRVIDYNLDGRKQLIIRYNSQFAPDPVLIVGWNEGTFTSPVALPFGSICYDPEEAAIFEVLDVDGNGLDDIIMYNNGTLHLYVRKGKKPDLMTRMVDGYGAQTTISYKPTSDPAVYTPGNRPVAYPQQRHKSGMWVVSDHTEDDGQGGANHFVHSYSDGRTDLRVPAFVGFRGYFRTHVETGETLEAGFDLTDRGTPGPFALCGLPDYTAIRTPMPDGLQHVVIEQTEFAIQYDATGKSWFPVAQTIRREEGMEDASYYYQIRRIVTNRLVDSFGNELQVQQKWDTGLTTLTNSEYVNNEANWLINLLQLRSVEEITADGKSQIRRTGYEYSANGLITRLVVEPGAPAGSQWNVLGPQADGVTTLFTSYDYNDDGLIIQATVHDSLVPAASARTTKYAYDPAESIFPVKQTNALGHVVLTDFHPGFGLPVLQTDENGITTGYVYDRFGRMTQKNEPGGIATNMIYVNGPLYPPSYSVERIGGVRQIFHYDSLGRLIQLSRWNRHDGKETKKIRSFDSSGRVSAMSMYHFAGGPPRWSFFRYDPLDRMLVAYLPDGTSWQYTYGDSNPPFGAQALRRLQVRNPRGNNTFTFEDEPGRVVRNTGYDGTNSVTDQVSYGPFDNLSSVSGPGSYPINLTTDRLGRTISILDPDAGRRTVEYNAFGDIIQITDPNGSTQFGYDLLGRVTQQISSDGILTYTWDTFLKGKLSEINSPFNISTIYQYDNAGRMNFRQWVTPAGIFEFQFSYDAWGRISTIQFPAIPFQPPLVISYEYGDFGQILLVNNETSGKPLWKLLNTDATNEFGRWKLGNGVIEEWQENSARPGYIGSIVANRGSKKIQHLDYSFDETGNLMLRKDPISMISETFGYDGYDRLTQWTYNGPGGADVVKYRYDPLWNLRVRSGGAAEYFIPVPGLAGPHAAVKTAAGDCKYDKKGNQVHAPGRDIIFTSFDLPSSLSTDKEAWSYLYDGEGHRVAKTSNDTGAEIVSIAGAYDRRKSDTGYEHHFKIVLPGVAEAEIVIRENGKTVTAPLTYYLHKDHLGSVRVVTESGSIVDRVAYDPFGRRTDPGNPGLPGTAPVSGIYKGYAGHEHDEESGLINMIGRIYDPVSGRFLTPDPIIADATLAKSLNPYTYVYNNPQTLRDATGLYTDNPDSAEDDNLDSCGSPLSDTPTGDTPPVPGVDMHTPGNTDNGVDGCMSPGPGNSPAAPMTFTPVAITLVNYPTVNIYLQNYPQVDIYLSADTSTASPAPQPPVQQTPGHPIKQALSDAANTTTVGSAIGISTLQGISNGLFRGRSVIKNGYIGDRLAVFAARASITVGKLVENSPALGRFLGGVKGVARVAGPIASGVGVAIGVYDFATAANRPDKVQAASDVIFSGIGFTGVGTLGSACYSGVQLADRATGFTTGISKLGSSQSPNIPNRFGNWLGDKLGL